MLYEVALTPDVFSATEHKANPALTAELKALLRDLVHNGLIADLHKGGLSKHIYEEIKAFPQQQRPLVMSLLNTLKDRQRFVEHPKSSSEPLTAQSWLGLALYSHKQTAFHSIVVGRELAAEFHLEDGRLLELSQVLDSQKWQERALTPTVSTDEQGYRTVLAPILRYAKAVDLIDPFLSANDKKGKFVELCAELLGQRCGSRESGRIHIHASKGQFNSIQKHTVADWFNDWRVLLVPLHQQYGHRFRVFLWEKPTEGQRFHDRFILTDQCGVSIPAGFDFVKGSSTDWSFLDHQTTLQRRDQFRKDNNGVFEHVKGFTPLEVGF